MYGAEGYIVSYLAKYVIMMEDAKSLSLFSLLF